jgi:hypothetical protein
VGTDMFVSVMFDEKTNTIYLTRGFRCGLGWKQHRISPIAWASILVHSRSTDTALTWDKSCWLIQLFIWWRMAEKTNGYAEQQWAGNPQPGSAPRCQPCHPSYRKTLHWFVIISGNSASSTSK